LVEKPPRERRRRTLPTPCRSYEGEWRPEFTRNETWELDFAADVAAVAQVPKTVLVELTQHLMAEYSVPALAELPTSWFAQIASATSVAAEADPKALASRIA
jgi:hypothetical protein